MREVQLPAGKRSTIDFDRRGRARVRVKLRPASDVERARGGSLRWTQFNSQGE